MQDVITGVLVATMTMAPPAGATEALDCMHAGPRLTRGNPCITSELDRADAACSGPCAVGATVQTDDSSAKQLRHWCAYRQPVMFASEDGCCTRGQV